MLLGAGPEQTIRDLYASSAQTRDVAALAPLVLRAAGEGDDVALAAVREVAGALVEMAAAAGARLGDTQLTLLPVAAVGGLFADELFRSTVAGALREQLPHTELRSGAGDALQGGRLLATTRNDPVTRQLTSAFRKESP